MATGAPFSRVPGLRLRSVATALLAAVVLECTIGSSGRLLVIGGVSLRMFLLFGLLLAVAPFAWRERRSLVEQPFVRVVGLFFAVLAVAAAWGLRLGNAHSFVVNDLTTFAMLLTVPGVMALHLSRRELSRLAVILFWGSVALAVGTTVVWVLITTAAIDVNAANRWINERTLGGIALGDGVYRVYFRSHVLLIPALALGVWRGATDGRLRRTFLAATGLILVAELLSFTRSIWVGSVVAMLVLVILGRSRLPRLATSMAVALCFFVLAGVALVVIEPRLSAQTVGRLNPGLVVGLPSSPPTQAAPTPSRPSIAPTPTPTPTSPAPTPSPTTGDAVSDTNPADARAVRVRSETLRLHRERIAERPMTGWGLGANLDSIRDDGRTEYMYWDMLMKLGALGFLVFLAVWAWIPGTVFLRTLRSGEVPPASIPLSAAIAGIAVTSYFNPFLNSPLGLVVLLVAAAALCVGDAGPADLVETAGRDGDARGHGRRQRPTHARPRGRTAARLDKRAGRWRR